MMGSPSMTEKREYRISCALFELIASCGFELRDFASGQTWTVLQPVRWRGRPTWSRATWHAVGFHVGWEVRYHDPVGTGAESSWDSHSPGGVKSWLPGQQNVPGHTNIPNIMIDWLFIKKKTRGRHLWSEEMNKWRGKKRHKKGNYLNGLKFPEERCPKQRGGRKKKRNTSKHEIRRCYTSRVRSNVSIEQLNGVLPVVFIYQEVTESSELDDADRQEVSVSSEGECDRCTAGAVRCALPIHSIFFRMPKNEEINIPPLLVR